MTILNFVTQNELDSLDDDPQIAFMELVNFAQRNLAVQLNKLDPENEQEWRDREDLKQRFMNVIIASAKRFEIEPFVSMDVPRYSDFRASDYKQFESDIDHYVTQLVLDNRVRSKSLSIEMTTDTKDRIRSYVHGLRSCIEQSSIDPAKRSKLLDKLDHFEAELEKRRVKIISSTLLALSILGIPGSLGSSADVAQRLLMNITQVFAEAKTQEEQNKQLDHTSSPKALSPPRAQSPASPQSLDIDDEIPF